MQYIEEHNIQTRALFAGNIIKHPCMDEFRETESYRVVGSLENTECVLNNTFWIGVYPGMNKDKLDYMVKPLYAYLMIAAFQYEDGKYAGYYNVGPDDQDCFQTGALVDLFVKSWGKGLQWIDRHDSGPHEANFLKLDCSKIKSTFGWKPCWNLEKAIDMVVEWSKCWISGGDVRKCMDEEIRCFIDAHRLTK